MGKTKEKKQLTADDETDMCLPADSDTGPLRRELRTLTVEFKTLSQDLKGKYDEIIMNQNEIKTRITSIEEKQRELEIAITYTSDSVTDCEEKLSTFTTNIKEISSTVESNKTKINQLEDELLKMERHSRGFNLRFGGIDEDPNENTALKLKDIIENKLHLPNIQVENSHRTGKKGMNKPRHIIAKFLFRPQRLEVLRKAKALLKHSNVFVMEDLPMADVIKKRQLQDIMKKAYTDGKRAVFRNGHLYIDGKLHS